MYVRFTCIIMYCRTDMHGISIFPYKIAKHFLSVTFLTSIVIYVAL